MISENKDNIEKVKIKTISCQGSDDKNDGHPKIWLKIPSNKDSINCPYCEKIFIFTP